MKPQNPQTPQEWQAAVDAAKFFLALDSCRMYGLIKGGLHVNAVRCSEILIQGQQLGYRPASLDELCKEFIR